MKIFLFAYILLLSGIVTEAQESFMISGNIRGLNAGTAMLSYSSENTTKQVSAKIKKGKFFIKGSLPESERLMIRVSNNRFNGEIFFFAGNENISIIIDTAILNNPVVEGSQTQKEYEIYRQLTNAVDQDFEMLNRTGSALYQSGKLTEWLKDSLFSVHDKLDLEKRSVIAVFAEKYPASAVSAWAISSFFGFDPHIDELTAVFNLLSEKNQLSLYGRQIIEIIDAAKKTAIGNTAPDFTADDINGMVTSLSSYRGKYVLVDFWASWCGPCRAENSNVVNCYNQYHSGKFDILGVSLDTNKDAWMKAIKNDKLEWTQISDLKAWDSKIVAEYGIKGIPFNMLLNKEGKIIAKNLRGMALENKLKEVLN